MCIFYFSILFWWFKQNQLSSRIVRKIILELNKGLKYLVYISVPESMISFFKHHFLFLNCPDSFMTSRFSVFLFFYFVPFLVFVAPRLTPLPPALTFSSFFFLFPSLVSFFSESVCQGYPLQRLFCFTFSLFYFSYLKVFVLSFAHVYINCIHK